MRISDVAKLLSVSKATIRRIETLGLIKAPIRDRNDQRRYTEADVEALRKVIYDRVAEVAPPGAKASPRSDRVDRLVDRLRAGKEAAHAKRTQAPQE